MENSMLALAAKPPTDPEERKALYEAAKKLMYSVESSHDLEHRVYYGGIPLYVADVAIDLGIFKALADKKDSGFSAHELAKHLGCEELLVSRITRALAAYGLVDNAHDGGYIANANTLVFASHGVEGGVRHNALNMLPTFTCLSQCIRKLGMKSPTNVKDTAWQIAFNTDQEPFTWLNDHPKNLQAAVTFMSSQRADQVGWIEDDTVFPSRDFELSKEDVANDRVLMIDVGGGMGHQCIAVRSQRPDLQGRIILQDLPHTIALIDKNQLEALKIEAMAHDFTTPQPVKGAKVYYWRNVLHDWTDDICLTLLRHQRAAMAKDSVLIIDEIVVTEPGSNYQQVNFDIAMMAAMASLERTLEQWKVILKKTGFSIREVREYDHDKGDSLIIAVPI